MITYVSIERFTTCSHLDVLNFSKITLLFPVWTFSYILVQLFTCVDIVELDRSDTKRGVANKVTLWRHMQFDY